MRTLLRSLPVIIAYSSRLTRSVTKKENTEQTACNKPNPGLLIFLQIILSGSELKYENTSCRDCTLRQRTTRSLKLRSAVPVVRI